MAEGNDLDGEVGGARVQDADKLEEADEGEVQERERHGLPSTRHASRAKVLLEDSGRRSRHPHPYSKAEIASYLALCDAQPTTLRRLRANALICLGAGAGLIGGELRFVRGTDVVCRSGGVLVVVRAKTSRVVPVRGEFHERLLGSAAFFKDGYLVSGRNPESRNVTNPPLRSLSGGAHLPRLETCRLRSTYLVAMAEAIGLKAFMEAAGITCSQRLGDLVKGLEAPSEQEAVALLGGRRP
jgi:integrase